jgi:hypothetical protein
MVWYTIIYSVDITLEVCFVAALLAMTMYSIKFRWTHIPDSYKRMGHCERSEAISNSLYRIQMSEVFLI